jgi:hypothetical protein
MVAPETISGSILEGLLVDAAGKPMALRASRAARPRYYVSNEDGQRIAATRIERNVTDLLRRLRLAGGPPHEVAKVLRRIVVCRDCLVYQLERRACVTRWRAQGLLSARPASADVLQLLGTWLPREYEVADVGWVLCLTVRRPRTR